MTWLLNPNNGVFASLCRSWCCVDKTQVLAEINRLIEERPSIKLLITRPRHTGKSAFLGMLSAYYSCGAESDALFRTMCIASDESYRRRLNRYPVIFFDMACQFDDYRASESDVRKTTFAQWLERAFLEDVRRTFPGDEFFGSSFEHALSRIMGLPRQPYILLIDNWDAPYRKTDMDFDADYSGYADFLRRLLYGVDRMKPVLTCFTGIFPFPDDWLKEPDWQSFQMSTMTYPGTCADWIGYTDAEVRHLAAGKDADPVEAIRHCGGYFSESCGLSLPGAVNRYLRCKNHPYPWIGLQTEYLNRLLAPRRAGFDEIAYALAARQEVPVHLSSDFAHLFRCHSNDAVLTSWVHHGYLAYRKTTQTVTLPNADTLQAFRRALKSVSW